MAFFVTANTPLLCPLCRRFNVEYAKNDYKQSWNFFCHNCKVGTEIKQTEIEQLYRKNKFAGVLREKLAAALGRGNKLEPQVVPEGPKLQIADGQSDSPLGRKKKDPPDVGPLSVPPYEEPKRKRPKLWDKKKNPNKRVQQRTKIRQALQRAQRTIVEDEDG